jgi:cation transport regulator ChaB
MNNMTTEADPELVKTFTERYERAEKLLETILESAAKQYKDGASRRVAKIGTMKAIIMRWAAREPECMESLEYLATH